MQEIYDHKAEFKAAYKKLGEDIQACVNRAAGHGVPDLVIADQLLYVSLTMIVTFLEYGYEEINAKLWTVSASSEFGNQFAGKAGRSTISAQIHAPGGDTVSVLTEITAISMATRQAREEMLEIARSNVGTLFPGELCGTIIGRAVELGSRARSSSVTRWPDAVSRTLERFESGELRSDEDLLAIVANRGLSSGTREKDWIE